MAPVASDAVAPSPATPTLAACAVNPMLTTGWGAVTVTAPSWENPAWAVAAVGAYPVTVTFGRGAVTASVMVIPYPATATFGSCAVTISDGVAVGTSPVTVAAAN